MSYRTDPERWIPYSQEQHSALCAELGIGERKMPPENPDDVTLDAAGEKSFAAVVKMWNARQKMYEGWAIKAEEWLAENPEEADGEAGYGPNATRPGWTGWGGYRARQMEPFEAAYIRYAILWRDGTEDNYETVLANNEANQNVWHAVDREWMQRIGANAYWLHRAESEHHRDLDSQREWRDKGMEPPPHWTDATVAARYELALAAAAIGQGPKEWSAASEAVAKHQEAERIAALAPEEIAMESGRLF